MTADEPSNLDEKIEQLVREIHDSGWQFVLSLTGGGSRAASSLLEVPGASRSVLEATIPYAAEALADWLGATPEHSCSPETARAMAMAGYQRAVRLTSTRNGTSSLAGIACTASLATDRPKRGSHRLHLAAQSGSETWSRSLVLNKGARTRDGEEQIALLLVLNLIAERCGVTTQIPVSLLPGERIERDEAKAPRAWQELLAGRLPAVSQGPVAASGAARAIFPGAFHPRHDGHQRMAEVTRQMLDVPVEYEISALNVDKPPLDFIEMSARASQFDSSEALWFTRAPTFAEKSLIFPGAWFVVGVDTIVRIAEPRYYANNPQTCADGIAQIAAEGCKFLVFGRNTAAGFQTLDWLKLPPALQAICRGVSAEEFRADISSTEIRAKSADQE